ncbi:MAG: protein-L-isoaspartate O-methyltransferase [delta proteobacterium MLS_D]|nr:MAG: protein-L-isoaspartate O-methyltransferase [delta proteobacterium MLS_D]
MTKRKTVIIVIAAAILAVETFPALSGGRDTDRTRVDRARMVATLTERYDIHDESVLQAIARVPRHLFVPASQRRNAYEDRPLPIGYGQTISQPFIVAYMTGVIGVTEDSRVLEIGTGSGYQAAVLAEITEEVYTIEIIPDLAMSAEENLRRAGVGTVRVRHGDGYYGWPDAAPFDAIIVTAAAPHIPPPLLEQLKDDGIMVIPVGSPYRTQQLVLIEKVKGRPRTRNLIPVRFVPLTRQAEP